MGMPRVSRLIWATALVCSLCAQPPKSRAQADPQNKLALQDVSESLGPFVIAGQSFTIVLHSKELTGVPAGTLTRTLVQLEVRDRSGAALYQKTFPYHLANTGFDQVIRASARLLAGDNLAGLLVTYTREPGPPESEQFWQFFGFRQGKLALFDPPGQEPMNAPARFTGVVMMTPSGPASMPIPNRGPLDDLEFRAWTGNYYAIVPLKVDWRSGKLMVSQHCLESGGAPGLHEVGCDMRVEAQRVPSNAEFSFARIFPTPQEQPGIAVQHAVIPRGAEVQLLKAKAIATWVADGDVMRIQFSDLWLKVLINNNTEYEGWIRGEQDLAAIGLPARSPNP